MRYFLTLFLATQFLSCQSGSPELVRADYTKVHSEALAFCAENDFNQQYYFLVDFAKHSGKFRFWVYEFESNSVIDSGLVAHGSCDVFDENTNPYKNVLTSNIPNSHCSSIGKYKVGMRDYSSWGIHVKYWLHGLESTNNKAEERVVVLHSWEALTDSEIYPEYSALSWGCPAVSDNFMKRLDDGLKNQTKPTLLWIVTK